METFSDKHTTSVKYRRAVFLATLAVSGLGLTDRGEENDGEEISDGLHASHHLCSDYVALGGQQRSCQKTAQLHGNVQELCHLQSLKKNQTKVNADPTFAKTRFSYVR